MPTKEETYDLYDGNQGIWYDHIPKSEYDVGDCWCWFALPVRDI